MPDSDTFFSLIDAFNAADETRRGEIDRQITTMFTRRRAAMAVDMSGFTRLVRQHGTVHYVAMIRRMHDVACRIIPETGGRLVKFDADNFTALFETASLALGGAESLQRALEADNAGHPRSARIVTSIGIAWGDVLDVPGYDANGDPINLGYKLGEDLAEAGEILIDAAAYDELETPDRQRFDARHFSISGVDVEAYSLGGG